MLVAVILLLALNAEEVEAEVLLAPKAAAVEMVLVIQQQVAAVVLLSLALEATTKVEALLSAVLEDATATEELQSPVLLAMEVNADPAVLAAVVVAGAQVMATGLKVLSPFVGTASRVGVQWVLLLGGELFALGHTLSSLIIW